jgi:hypothetical protein
VLIDYYVCRESIELLPVFLGNEVLEHVFERRTGGDGWGIGLGEGCFEKLQSLVASSSGEFDPYRES